MNYISAMRIIAIFTLLALLCAHSGASSVSISSEQREQLLQGKQIVIEEKSEEGPWPVIRLYQLIDATPLESLAIFFALDYQKEYVPNVIKSEISKVNSPTEVWVQYELEMPWPMSNSHYLHSHKLQKVGEDRYRVDWKMEESDSTEKVNGFAEFYPFTEGKTLMVYENKVIPKSVFAGLVKGTMVSDVQKTLQAIRDEVLLCKKSKKDILSKYKKKIEDSLKGKMAYEVKKKM